MGPRQPEGYGSGSREPGAGGFKRGCMCGWVGGCMMPAPAFGGRTVLRSSGPECGSSAPQPSRPSSNLATLVFPPLPSPPLPSPSPRPPPFASSQLHRGSAAALGLHILPTLPGRHSGRPQLERAPQLPLPRQEDPEPHPRQVKGRHFQACRLSPRQAMGFFAPHPLPHSLSHALASLTLSPLLCSHLPLTLPPPSQQGLVPEALGHLPSWWPAALRLHLHRDVFHLHLVLGLQGERATLPREPG
jgi:hypothetical protein